MKLVFIHGANATPLSFNFIDQHFNRYDKIYLRYSSLNSFENNLTKMISYLSAQEPEPFLLVSHSLGGIYAMHIENVFKDLVKGSVSLATPFNGSESAYNLSIFKPCQLYKDIMPSSSPIRGALKMVPSCPWTQLVTTCGHSHLLNEPNDGVVTLDSMRSHKRLKTVDIEAGHYEIMLHPRPVEVIFETLEELKLS